jgi:aryl-alcohol dehydrogenase-like predicted oxidoreductase
MVQATMRDMTTTVSGDPGLPLRGLGRTGEKVSILCLGGGHLGRPAVEHHDAVRIVQRAVDEGFSFMDNAWEYFEGTSEDRMGEALATGGRRDKVMLMTKVCARDRAGAMQNLEESLRRLRTDRIDLWQFHEINYDNDPDWVFATDGAIEAAEEARKQGKVRFIGFTAHKAPHIAVKMLEQRFDFDTVQMPLNVMDARFRSFEREVLPILVERHIGVLAMKTFGGGKIVTQGGVSPSEALRYALSLPVSTVVTGVDSMEVLEQNLAIARSFEPMKPDERDALLVRTETVAGDGRCELFKTTQFFDSKVHQEQHEFAEGL